MSNIEESPLECTNNTDGMLKCCECGDKPEIIHFRYDRYINGRPLYRYSLCSTCIPLYEDRARRREERGKRWYWRFYWRSSRRKRYFFSWIKSPYYKGRRRLYQLKRKWELFRMSRNEHCGECEYLGRLNCFVYNKECGRYPDYRENFLLLLKETSEWMKKKREATTN